MSRVFAVRENALGRDVVVKVLALELSASASRWPGVRDPLPTR